MKDIKIITTKRNECKDGENGYKIIEWNVTDLTESLYAVVTPIKKQ
ncbi:hypothetical protein [Neobacillus kokaensis]|uniref:Uncharacterized protein n=1 Tax=Neobacillus kokaensis TaxID=2759023 RepID=A0ABQ3N6P0_9BACI|nr:hypothetical protein [Neobacillus kokaensis]GHH99192.1 hypothetical protein AM1BK_27350 [Neobacillus kokaensis]